MKYPLHKSPVEPNLSTQLTIDWSYSLALCAPDGIVVECGIAAGNQLGAMIKAGRKGIGFDSFEGIPYAGEHDSHQPGWFEPIDSDKIGVLESSGVSAYTMEDVRSNFERWGIDANDYRLIKGWFEVTVPKFKAPVKIAVLRLDGDLYESTRIPLVYLQDRVVLGGFLIIDDWILSGCRKACDEYINKDRFSLIGEVDNVAYFKRVK